MLRLITSIDDKNSLNLIRQCGVICLDVFGFSGINLESINFIKHLQTYTFVIEESTSKVVGFMQHTHPALNDVLMVNVVIAHKSGLGIGKMLMESISTFGEREIKLNYVTLDLVNYYKKLGYEVTNKDYLDFDIGVDMVKAKNITVPT